jgi:autotransporter-associated beta strand protein
MYSGNLNDAGSGGALDKAGSGTLTLTGTNIYTGATTLAGGTLTLTNGGQIVSAGAVNINNGGGSTFNVNGGSLSAASMTMNNNNVCFIQSSGTSSFTNNVSFAADNANSGNSLQILGGTFNANSLTSGRTGLNFSTQPTAGQTTTVGIYITNATVNFTNTLGVGGRSSGANSSTSMRMDGGTLNVGGTTTITINNGGRWSVLDINGGTFISTDTNGAGVQIGGVYASESALFLIRAGTVSVNKITFGDLATQTSGTDVLNLTGGALYVGAGGIIITNPSPTFGTFITMSGGTVGASADWVSVLPITLSANVTFQAADIANVAHNIILSNALSGAGGLTKTGNGNLTLSAANAYTNSTVISGGTLVLSGTASIADSTNIDVVSGAQLDVSAVSPWTLVNGQTLKGSGSVIGSSVIAAGGSRIAPGESGLGTLTFGGALSLNGTTAMELNRAASPNSDRIVAASIAAGGTLTVTNIGAGLQAGDVFHLFSTAVSGSFAVTNLPATDPVNNLNYTWTNKLAVDGTIEVLTATSLINTNAFTLTNGFDGSKLTLSWPLDHTGYRLQAQTNTLTIGLYTNWVDIDAQFTPAANTTNKVNIPVNAGNGSVFYRLIYP